MSLTIRLDALGEGNDSRHMMGNFADDIWRNVMALGSHEIRGKYYYAKMEMLSGRPLRKKQMDELNSKLKKLNLMKPHLNAQIIKMKDET